MARKSNIVKKTKNNINLLVIVLLVVGWLCSVVSLLSNEEEKEQAALVQGAENLLEDKLYIRAVNNYKSALNNYKTDKNLEIQTKLLAVYLEAGMMEEYYDLIEVRMEDGTASAEEYIALADMYITNESYSKAIPVLQTGIDLYQNEDMIQMRESIIYEYRVRAINAADLIHPTTSWIVPVFDGTNWGYVTRDGALVLECIYEEAIPFYAGYAVVKLDGVYTLIDQNGYWNAIDKNGLDMVTDISDTAIVGVKDGKYQIYSRTFQLMSEEVYENIYLNDNGLYVVQQNGKWAILSSELEKITEFIFDDVAVNSRGEVFTGDYAMVKDQNGYFMITTEGKELYANRFDDAKGFEGGLCAVADETGKWGFANGSGELIVDHQYTDARGFSSNLGAVEYAGKWGYINRYNNMIIEAEYVEAYPFMGGSAITKTELGTYDVLTLKNAGLIK